MKIRHLSLVIHDEIMPMVCQVAQDSKAGIIDLNAAFTGKENLFSAAERHMFQLAAAPARVSVQVGQSAQRVTPAADSAQNFESREVIPAR